MRAVVHIRGFSYFIFSMLLVVCEACGSSTEPKNVAVGTYTLMSIDQRALPMQPESGGQLITAGSLTLEADGYFVLVETDDPSYRSTQGGTWIADGSILTLTDTASSIFGGVGGEVYEGTIAPHTILLTVPWASGADHVYRYER